MHWRILRVSINVNAWHHNFWLHVFFFSTTDHIDMWEAIKKAWRELTNPYDPSKHYFKGRKD